MAIDTHFIVIPTARIAVKGAARPDTIPDVVLDAVGVDTSPGGCVMSCVSVFSPFANTMLSGNNGRCKAPIEQAE